MDFAHTFSKTARFFICFNKHYTFYTKNLFIRSKHCVQSIFNNERWKKFRKNQFFSNIFTFLSVIHQNFEDNLRILANFGKFSRKKKKSTDFAHTFSKNYSFLFLYFLIKIIVFYAKSIHSAQKLRSNNFLQRKIRKVS